MNRCGSRSATTKRLRRSTSASFSDTPIGMPRSLRSGKIMSAFPDDRLRGIGNHGAPRVSASRVLLQSSHRIAGDDRLPNQGPPTGRTGRHGAQLEQLRSWTSDSTSATFCRYWLTLACECRSTCPRRQRLVPCELVATWRQRTVRARAVPVHTWPAPRDSVRSL